MSRCIARTRNFDRCRNPVERGHILFCRRHRWWGVLALGTLLISVTTLLANWAAITGTPLLATATPTPSPTLTSSPSPSPAPTATLRPVSDYLYYMVVIDASSAMADSFHGFRTWDVALETVNHILDKLNPDSHFGLVVVGGSGSPETGDPCSEPSAAFVPMADNNRNDVWERVSGFEPQRGGAFDVAFNTAKDELQSLPPDAVKMLIFVTGANDTCEEGDEWTELERAIELMKGIELYGQIVILDENGARSQSIADRINEVLPDKVNALAPQSVAQLQQVNIAVINNVTNYVEVAMNPPQVSTAPPATQVAQIATTVMAATRPATVVGTVSSTPSETQPSTQPPPTVSPTSTPPSPPPLVQLTGVEFKTTGIGCQIDVQVSVSNGAASGSFHVWNASFGAEGDIYPTTTLQVGTNWASNFSLDNLLTLGGNQPEYYQHEVWFEYNGVQSNRLVNLQCPGVP